MFDRFKGDEGQPVVEDALRQQAIVGNNEALAKALLAKVEVKQHKAGETLITQNAADNSACFILAGEAQVFINNTLIAERAAGTHVGEMAAIDPSAPRSATVSAKTEVVAAWLKEADLRELGRTFPELYLGIARQLAKRLRERTDHVRAGNLQPRLFIGSSVEGLPAAREVQAGLEHDKVTVTIWTDDVVKPSEHVCDALVGRVRESDFALFHLRGDDRVFSRKLEKVAPRDNVILELGMFISVLGRDRVFMLYPRGVDVKVPSDLFGITPLEYNMPAKDEDLRASLGASIDKVRKAIRSLGYL